MTTLTILELFPEHLAVNGDMGNVIVVCERLRLAGIDSVHVKHNPGDALPASVDMVLVGTGPVSAQRVLEPAVAEIAQQLVAWRDAGVPMLAVTGGMQLLGSTIALPNGVAVAGAGLFPIHTDATAARVVTNCFAVDVPELGRLIGIENHGSRTTLTDGASAFGTVATGVGNDGRTEGVHVANAIGTHIQGPALAMNPVLADHLIEIAASRAGLRYELTEAHHRLDALASDCRAILARGAGIPVAGPVAA
ncbi:type 1 glutamine amidotransferase [Salinibacterium hongtaonis]|uniref:type 1 glutamine amidotransferase n=1 Tax=Homoserinimonas hongtaonis TaxID=2079791 RepID=UPI000D397FB2|nr:hypothetical protein [Salinibacterium hongtaonis]AWB89332.1 hypothetical protein C2138_07080 [Salinibacterium hongtaonis]